MTTNETKYRGFLIVPTDPVPPIPGWRSHMLTWHHADYDGPEDRRIGVAASEDACRAAIDEWIEENELPSKPVAGSFNDYRKWRTECDRINRRSCADEG